MRDRHMGSGAGRRACAALWLVTLALVLAAAPLAAVEARIAVVDMQRALNESDAELTKSIVQELYELVRDYGEKHGYTLVLEASSGALLYNDKTVDVTDEIVKLHNASPHKEGSKRSSSKE